MKQFAVSSSPHIFSGRSMPSIMRDVLIALIPSLLCGIWIFGPRALTVTLVSIASCVIFESVWNLLNKKENTVGDYSACVTGSILALSIPPGVPLWLPVIGGFFAIIICKQLYGGLGHNFINPALASRAFLMASWPVQMTAYTTPFAKLPWFASLDLADGITTATPLAIAEGGSATLWELFFGTVGGCIGETSVIAILLGGLYLMLRKVIRPEGPVVYLLTAALFGSIFSGETSFVDGFLFQLLSGGLLLGAFFMLTDYVTTPTTKRGMIIAAAIAGLFTALIRTKGGYPEGVTYAILLVNAATPLIERLVVPKPFGRVRHEKAR